MAVGTCMQKISSLALLVRQLRCCNELTDNCELSVGFFGLEGRSLGHDLTHPRSVDVPVDGVEVQPAAGGQAQVDAKWRRRGDPQLRSRQRRVAHHRHRVVVPSQGVELIAAVQLVIAVQGDVIEAAHRRWRRDAHRQTYTVHPCQ